MAVEKLSISVPPDVAALIRDRAEQAGVPVSVWVARAARAMAAGADELAAAQEAARQFAAEVEASEGPPARVDLAWAAEVLTTMGVRSRAAS